MSELSNEQFEWLHGLCFIDPHRAISVIREWETKFADDPNFFLNKSSLLIDAGSALRDPKVIEQGIALLEEEKERNRGDLGCNKWFNLGNGYYAAEAAKRGPGNVYSPTDTPMAKAKECYRKAIGKVSDEDLEFRASLQVNYGNTLDELWRLMEAIDEYEQALEIHPEHPIAWMRIGNCLMKLAESALNPQLIQDAIEAFTEALQDDRLERFGYGHERQSIQKFQIQARKRLQQVGGITTKNHHQLKIPTSYNRDFVEYCTQHRLFLNFSLWRRPSPHPYEDSFRLTLVTRIDDDTKLNRLVRVFNELTERFAIARLLLFEANSTPYDTTFFDTITRYIDLSDCSVYGIRAAKLKLSLENAYNVLDKIALFLNDYLELGMTESSIYFFNIWKDPKSLNLRTPILDRDNTFLYALYDLSCDLEKDGYLEHHKQLRNTSTHRYFVLHAFQEWDWKISDGSDYHSEWVEFLEHAQKLLYLVRNALMYLIAGIDLEERVKKLGMEKVYKVPGFRLHDSEFPLF
jgi:hypothetical protein